jgi:hypothetical protein
MVAVFPDVLLTTASCPVGTVPPDQLLPVFQSVLVVPLQSAALAAERPNEATKAVRMCVVNFFKFIFMPRTSHISLSSAIALSGRKVSVRLIFFIYLLGSYLQVFIKA